MAGGGWPIRYHALGVHRLNFVEVAGKTERNKQIVPVVRLANVANLYDNKYHACVTVP
jgi:hypothetical protein